MAGFQAVRTQSSGDTCGTVETYSMVAATGRNVAIGDVVRLSSGADADGRMQILPETSGTDGALGVIVGFGVDPTNLLTTGHFDASTAKSVRVSVDPLQLYRTDQVSPFGLGLTDVGQNVDTRTSVPTVNGNLLISDMGIVQGTPGSSSATRPWRLVSMEADDNGDLSILIVRPNSSSLAAGNANVGA